MNDKKILKSKKKNNIGKKGGTIKCTKRNPYPPCDTGYEIGGTEKIKPGCCYKISKNSKNSIEKTKKKVLKENKKENINQKNELSSKTFKELSEISENLVTDIENIFKKKPNRNWRSEIYQKHDKLLKIKQVMEKKNFKTEENLEYPSQENPLFNYLINKKKEFIDYKIILDENKDLSEKSWLECNKDFFKLTPNQIFLKNYISPSTPYKSLLIYHSMGVGKTATSIAIAEQFKDIIKKFKKKIYVLTPGSLTNNYYNGIFDINKFDKEKYIDSYRSLYLMKKKKNLKDIKNLNYVIPQVTGNTYIDGLINIEDLSNMSNTTINAKVKKNIKKTYSIQGHIQFCNYVNNIVEKATKGIDDKDEILYIRNKKYDEIFSNSIIIVDEAHKITEIELDDKIKKDKHIALTSRFGELLLDISKYTKNMRLLLLSATPMVDNSKEIITLLNLLLQNDKKALLDENKLFKIENDNYILKEKGKDYLKKIIKGYVSYMRSERPGVFPFRINPEEKIELSKLPKNWFNKDNQIEKINDKYRLKYLNNLILSYFEDEQFKVYKNKIESKNNHHNYSTEIAQISNIVYPNDSISKCYGEEGLKSVFNKKKNKYSYKPSFQKNKFLKYNNISRYSCKFKTIFDIIKNSEGIIFIYSQFISSGVIPFALFLEQNGFRRITSSKDSQLLDSADIDCEPLNYDCRKKSECDLTEFSQAGYILLTGEQLNKNPFEEVELLKKINSPDNKNGKNVKVVIGSKVTGEGFDFKCIREVHILDPWHNLNQIEQTIGRAIRRCSHQSLELKYRNVSIYLHTSMNPKKSKFKDIESIDLRMYRLAELKDRSIASVKRFLKEEAVDCMLNKVNNLYLEKDWNDIKIDIETSQRKIIKNFDIYDKDYSFICDYTLCNYNCFDKTNLKKIKELGDTEDFSTFQFSHSIDKINTLIDLIKNFFKKNIKYTNYSNIKNYIHSKNYVFTDILLVKALDDIIKNKIIIERDDGSVGFIIYRGSYYIFNEDDIFLPIEYRNDDYTKKKNSINIDLFLTKNIKNPEIKKEKNITISDILDGLPKKEDIDEISYISDSYLLECFKYIDKLDYISYQKLLELSILDNKLRKTKIGKILTEIFKEHITKDRSKYFMIDNSQKKAIKNYYIYDSKNNEFNLYNSENATVSTYEEPSQKIIGFLDKMKSGFVFKYADLKIDRVRGAVCAQNSKPGAICEFIKRVDSNIYDKLPYCNSEEKDGKKTKAKKVKLCEILENILREKEITKKSSDKKKWFFRYYLDLIPPVTSK